jgi:hypothetical protein
MSFRNWYMSYSLNDIMEIRCIKCNRRKQDPCIVTIIFSSLLSSSDDFTIIVHLRYYCPRCFFNVDFLSIKAVCKIKQRMTVFAWFSSEVDIVILGQCNKIMYRPHQLAIITGVKLMMVTIVTTIPRWRREKPVRSILLIISLCVVYLRTVCW